MQHLDISPRVRNIGDTIIVDLCPGFALRLTVTDSLKLLADLNRSTQRAMMNVEPEAVEIDVSFDDETTTEVRA